MGTGGGPRAIAVAGAPTGFRAIAVEENTPRDVAENLSDGERACVRNTTFAFKDQGHICIECIPDGVNILAI